MLSKWPIRNKFLFGIGLLLVIVATLSWSGFHGVYAYRSAVRSFRGRADELPLTNQISKHVSDLRVVVSAAIGRLESASDNDGQRDLDSQAMSAVFAKQFDQLRSTLADYRQHIVTNDSEDERLKDNSEEIETLKRMEVAVAEVLARSTRSDWMANLERLKLVHAQLQQLQDLSWELPSFLHQRIHDFADEVRTQRRALIFVNWVTTVSAALMLVLFIRLCYAWVFRPLQELVRGSRRVAAGEFGYRIALETHDEMSELAEAMNDMTARFEAIRDDLDRQVRERTKQVVRSEQLASVGFLAAGVAHEINNPLASIALCAESLEGRIGDILDARGEPSEADQEVIRNYLRMIQTEAFRCKGITERLLDFSRTGDRTRGDVDLRQLVRGVLDMVGHLYRQSDKHIDLVPGEPLVAPVNAQEIKQVVLNLVTNALDSLSPGGKLTVELRFAANQVEMIFSDDGCGMTDEVQEHLFEPFFTRRRNGQGTGLGLSITYRIIADHGGHIEAHSDGPNKGSRFRVTLPSAVQHKESRHRYQAA